MLKLCIIAFSYIPSTIVFIVSLSPLSSSLTRLLQLCDCLRIVRQSAAFLMVIVFFCVSLLIELICVRYELITTKKKTYRERQQIKEDIEIQHRIRQNVCFALAYNCLLQNGL